MGLVKLKLSEENGDGKRTIPNEWRQQSDSKNFEGGNGEREEEEDEEED